MAELDEFCRENGLGESPAGVISAAQLHSSTTACKTEHESAEKCQWLLDSWLE